MAQEDYLYNYTCCRRQRRRVIHTATHVAGDDAGGLLIQPHILQLPLSPLLPSRPVFRGYPSFSPPFPPYSPKCGGRHAIRTTAAANVYDGRRTPILRPSHTCATGKKKQKIHKKGCILILQPAESQKTESESRHACFQKSTQSFFHPSEIPPFRNFFPIFANTNLSTQNQANGKTYQEKQPANGSGERPYHHAAGTAGYHRPRRGRTLRSGDKKGERGLEK